MADKTKISWCDSTINWWEGCTKVSAGCANCYAEARDKRFTGGKLWGKGRPRRKSKGAVKDALRLNRCPMVCESCGKGWGVPTTETQCPDPQCRGKMHRRRIFSLSLGDWLDPEVPVEWLAEMLDTIRQCDQVTWILCTKRPELFWQRLGEVRKLWACDGSHNDTNEAKTYHWLCAWMELYNCAPKNVILLASVESCLEENEIPTPLEQSDPWLAEQLKLIATKTHPKVKTIILGTHGSALITHDRSIRRFGVPGPNDKCKCGSGKKYKKCCAK